MLNRTLLLLTFAACFAPAHAAEEAESGPRAERVIVTRTDGTRTEAPPPVPVRVKIRAYPSAQEIARATAAARAPRPLPLAVATPKPANPTPVAAAPTPAPPPAAAVPARPRLTALGAPLPPTPSLEPTPLTEKDVESLRWLTRLRAKYPARYTAELVRNARARQLIFAASRLSAAEQERIFRPALRDLEEDEGDDEEAEY